MDRQSEHRDALFAIGRLGDKPLRRRETPDQTGMSRTCSKAETLHKILNSIFLRKREISHNFSGK